MSDNHLQDKLPINWVRVNVYRVRDCDPREAVVWLVAPQEENGSEFIMSDRPSYISAMVDALSYGLPVYYHSGRAVA